MHRTLGLVLSALFFLPACSGAAGAPQPRDGAPTATTGHTAASAPNEWPFVAAPEDDGAVARLAVDPGPIKTNWVPPRRSDRYGRAEGLIAAPYDSVRATVLDFAHYGDIAGPKFSKVHVVGKREGTTDVYFNLPIMKGLLRIWYVTRFDPPRKTSDGEVVQGTLVKGNLRDMHIVFTLRPGADGNTTQMTCDLLLALNVPAPQANVDEELRDACGDAINAVRRSTAPAAVAAAK